MMLIAFVAKNSIVQVMGFMRGEIAIYIAQTVVKRRESFIGEHSRDREYYVGTADWGKKDCEDT